MIYTATEAAKIYDVSSALLNLIRKQTDEECSVCGSSRFGKKKRNIFLLNRLGKEFTSCSSCISVLSNMVKESDDTLSFMIRINPSGYISQIPSITFAEWLAIRLVKYARN